MLRLSIVVPYRSEDQRFEDTLLSILENRPKDSEVIVVDDGSYADPYDLSDEVCFVSTQPGASLTEKLNSGVLVAKASFVCNLLDGMLVAGNWAEPALRHLTSGMADVVSPSVNLHSRSGLRTIFGLDCNHLNSDTLRRGKPLATSPARGVTPTIAGGFYRKKALLAVNGWSTCLSSMAADVELGMLLTEAGVCAICEPMSVVSCDESTDFATRNVSMAHELSAISSAFGLAQASGLFSNACNWLASYLKGDAAVEKAWHTGAVDLELIAGIQERLGATLASVKRQAADSISRKAA